jgi:hypothetical protein
MFCEKNFNSLKNCLTFYHTDCINMYRMSNNEENNNLCYQALLKQNHAHVSRIRKQVTCDIQEEFLEW